MKNKMTAKEQGKCERDIKTARMYVEELCLLIKAFDKYILATELALAENTQVPPIEEYFDDDTNVSCDSLDFLGIPVVVLIKRLKDISNSCVD